MGCGPNWKNKSINIVINSQDWASNSKKSVNSINSKARTTFETLTITGHLDSISKIIQLKDTRIASASHDCLIKIWSISPPYKCVSTLNKHTEPVLSLFQCIDESLLSSGADIHIYQWDIKKETVINTFIGHDEAVYDILQISTALSMFISCSEDTEIFIWNTKNKPKENKGQLLLKLLGHTSKVNMIKEYTKTSRKFEYNLISCSNDCSIKLWFIQESLITSTPITLDGDDCCLCIEVLYNGNIVGGYMNNKIIIWDPVSQTNRHIIKTLKAYITYILWDNEEDQLLCGDNEGNVLSYNNESRDLIREVKAHKSNISCIWKLSNGKICSSGYDNVINFWWAK